MQKLGTICEKDVQLFLVTDSVNEGINYIYNKLEKKYGSPLKIKTSKTRWWLGEKV